MTKSRVSFTLFGAAIAVAMSALSANAQATRTWVSGVGDDVNPCSRTAPCKTFAGAISKTATGGEINCLDPAGYGAVTIGKAITIDCSYTYGSVLASSTTGIIVNITATTAVTDIVRLVGLSLNGGTITAPGNHGVRFLRGAAVHVENSKIYNFRGAAPGGNGISMEVPTGLTSELHVSNTAIEDNGATPANTGAGISVTVAGTANARITVSNSKISNNSVGIKVNGAGGSGVIRTMVRDSVISDNTSEGVFNTSTGATAIAFLERNTVFANGTGIRSDGAQSTVEISGNTITLQTGAGLSATGGGALLTYSNNAITTNSGGDGATTGTLTPFK